MQGRPVLCALVTQIATLSQKMKAKRMGLVKRKCVNCGELCFIAPRMLAFVLAGHGYPVCHKCVPEES